MCYVFVFRKVILVFSEMYQMSTYTIYACEQRFVAFQVIVLSPLLHFSMPINHCLLCISVTKVSPGERWLRDKIADTIFSIIPPPKPQLFAQTTSHYFCFSGQLV